MQVTANRPTRSISTQSETLKKLNGTLAHLLTSIQQFFASSSELQVDQWKDGDTLWWHAYDPRTGKCVYTDSETELHCWIRDNHRPL